jgi:glucosyl-3-phosphoglycerate phosphatase
MTQGPVAVGVQGWSGLLAAAQAEPAELALDHFLFLRHGETARNVERIYQTPEEPLNANGEAQARAAAALLGRRKVGALWASPMARAWRTANLVGEACGVAPRPEADLRERLFTSLWGTPASIIDWSCDPDGCESIAAFTARVRRGARAAHVGHADGGQGELLLVAHGGVLLALCAWLGVPVEEAMRKNAQPIRFARAGGRWQANLIGEAQAASAIT